MSLLAEVLAEALNSALAPAARVSLDANSLPSLRTHNAAAAAGEFMEEGQQCIAMGEQVQFPQRFSFGNVLLWT